MKVTDKQYYMDGYLENNLYTVAYNLQKDWDFVFVVAGSGDTRIGKSVLAQQIAYYIAHHHNTSFSEDNIVFSGEELISFAKKNHKQPYTSIIYDEARRELDSKKTMHTISQNLQDFFAECGAFNHFIVLVLPDFFELNRRLAITKSRALINVKALHKQVKYRGRDVIEFERGFFDFFNRDDAKRFYIEAKKQYEDYSLASKYRSFYGRFTNVWVLDKDLYMKKKLAFMMKDRKEKDKPVIRERDKIILRMLEQGLVHEEISKLVGLSRQRVSQISKDLAIAKAKA